MTAPRTPLTRERVLEAAVGLADESGVASLTMRRVAERVGVEAMSLYYHVANKEALLDGIAEVVVDEINQAVEGLEIPSAGAGWQRAVRQRILSARQVLLRHPWAPRVLETRTNTSQAVLRYIDGLVGLLRDGGFSYDVSHHALHAFGSRALGFTQELFDPGDGPVDAEALAAMEQLAHRYPHLVGMLRDVAHDADTTLGWCDDQAEFEFGLDLLLTALEARRPGRG